MCNFAWLTSLSFHLPGSRVMVSAQTSRLSRTFLGEPDSSADLSQLLPTLSSWLRGSLVAPMPSLPSTSEVQHQLTPSN